MGLEAFETSDESDDSDSNSSEPERVGKKEKFQTPELCPRCGKEGEHIRNNEYRCTTDSSECQTISWFHNSYEVDHASLS